MKKYQSMHINCNCSLFGLCPGPTTHCSFFAEVSLAIIILNQLQCHRRSASLRGRRTLSSISELSGAASSTSDSVTSANGWWVGGRLFEVGRFKSTF